MKKLKQPLDERQEREMYGVYKLGFFVLFWGIFVLLILGANFQLESSILNTISFALLIAGASIVAVGSAKRGIWPEAFEPSTKNNLIISFCCAAFVFFVGGILPPLVRYGANELTSAHFANGGIFAAITFVLAFVTFNILMRAVKNRRSKLETDYED